MASSSTRASVDKTTSQMYYYAIGDGDVRTGSLDELRMFYKYMVTQDTEDVKYMYSKNMYVREMKEGEETKDDQHAEQAKAARHHHTLGGIPHT